MLTSEYMVLKGALALAVPTRYGQYLDVADSDSPHIEWISKDQNGHIWFRATYNLNDLATIKTTDSEVSDRLTKWLRFIKTHRPDLYVSPFRIETLLEFDRNWGLGSSSSLVSNLAKWGNVDPINLLHAGMKGSGYDVAVGIENTAILYQIGMKDPHWERVVWNPKYMQNYRFVYLGKKAKSEGHVIDFTSRATSKEQIDFFNQITNDVIKCADSSKLGALLQQHEDVLSDILQRPTIKQQLFGDYPKVIKSLGAWGGDFILVEGTEADMAYFESKGYFTILPWSEMIKTIS